MHESSAPDSHALSAGAYAQRAAQAQASLARLRGGISPRIPLTPVRRTPWLPRVRTALRTLHPRLWLHAVIGLVVLTVGGGELLGLGALRATQAPPAELLVASSEPASSNATIPGLGAPLAQSPVALVRPDPVDPLAPALVQPVELPGAYHPEHTLLEGETLGALADRYALSLDSLVWANQLDLGDALIAGQRLRIPRVDGISHTVAAGETLEQLAAQFGVAFEAIATFEPNGLGPQLELQPGYVLFIPGGTRPLPEAWLNAVGGYAGLAARGPEPAAIVQADQTNLRSGPSTEHPLVAKLDAGRQVSLRARYGDWLQVALGTFQGWMRADLLAVAPEAIAALPENSNFPAPPPRWVWPARGSISSRFGPRWGSFHNGLDIANRAWTPIVAARTGRVTEAGWCSGYGYCVKMRHDGGITTHYGHLVARPPVRVGDEIKAGDLIGYMGSTYDRAGGGYSTGVHLHFTVLINGRAVDPLRVLP